MVTSTFTLKLEAVGSSKTLVITYENTWCDNPGDHFLITSLSKMTINCRPTNLGTQSTDNSFIKKLKSSGRSLVVFYGSQTGTGEEFAGRLAKEGIRYHLKGMVADPEECDMVCRTVHLFSEIGYFHSNYKLLSFRVFVSFSEEWPKYMFTKSIYICF